MLGLCVYNEINKTHSSWPPGLSTQRYIFGSIEDPFVIVSNLFWLSAAGVSAQTETDYVTLLNNPE